MKDDVIYGIWQYAKMLKIEGYLSPFEADFLTKVATGGVVCEVGSFKGLSSYCMASTAKLLHCVDTFKADEGGQDQEGDTLKAFKKATSRFNNVKTHVGLSQEVCDEFEDNTFDIIFIDADHSKESVIRDIESWFPKLRKDGYMLFHDYDSSWPGVIEAVHKFDWKVLRGPGSIVYISKEDSVLKQR